MGHERVDLEEKHPGRTSRGKDYFYDVLLSIQIEARDCSELRNGWTPYPARVNRTETRSLKLNHAFSIP